MAYVMDYQEKGEDGQEAHGVSHANYFYGGHFVKRDQTAQHFLLSFVLVYGRAWNRQMDWPAEVSSYTIFLLDIGCRILALMMMVFYLFGVDKPEETTLKNYMGLEGQTAL